MHDELKQIISQAMNTRFDFEQKLIQRAWEDEAFKQELLSNPKAVFARESGEELPKDIEFEVIQETTNKVYLVLPTNPAPDITQELSEEALETVAGGIDGCTVWSRVKSVCIGWSAVRNANNLA
ncbi:MAG: NHLP leader peptide family RiPP precursor [Spirirestis rafaelensis WJT71-NPBG6]|jgi:hypothetical protein|nr:NHLP leader peptide family RiPP precursor [Spirirestis rafaelensis WJT71-NPBG6]